MKRLIRKIISSFTSLLCKLRLNIRINKSLIFFPNFKGITGSNQAVLKNANINRCLISLEGENNEIVLSGKVYKSSIRISGKNNKLIISDNCSFNFSTIIVRGDNCTVSIDQGTTFGQVYMVCMGTGNEISIGSNCMFAEDIDIWSSDSHPIFNSEREIINCSRPIHIGDHVWVGKGCKILKGVNIGSDAIIGMNSLVTKDIKPGSLNVGSPAKCIKENVSWDRNFIKI